MTAKIALITGANKGIGFETARQLGSRGMTVLAGARDEARGREAERALRNGGADARFVQLDVTDAISVQRAAECAGAAESSFCGRAVWDVASSSSTATSASSLHPVWPRADLAAPRRLLQDRCGAARRGSLAAGSTGRPGRVPRASRRCRNQPVARAYRKRGWRDVGLQAQRCRVPGGIQRGRRPSGATGLDEDTNRGMDAYDRRGTPRTWDVIGAGDWLDPRPLAVTGGQRATCSRAAVR
jgi:hypothetical protein